MAANSSPAPAKLVALYTRPDNPEAFDRRYFEGHVPLAEKLPGLRRMEVVKLTGNVMGGPAPYYLMAELYFDSMDALQAALKSPEGRAAGQDVMSFAAANVTLLTAEAAGLPATAGQALP